MLATTISCDSSGALRQFLVMWRNSLCSILFHLRPAGSGKVQRSILFCPPTVDGGGAPLGDDWVNHFAADIGHAVTAAVVGVGQFFVVEAQ